VKIKINFFLNFKPLVFLLYKYVNLVILIKFYYVYLTFQTRLIANIK